MQARVKNLIRFLLVWIVTAQSVLPASALAQVQMHCVGMAANAEPCARAVMPIAEMDSWQAHTPPLMACCTHRPSPISQIAAPTCVVSVTLIGNERTALASHTQAWMLDAAPGCAPPTRSPRLSFALITARLTHCQHLCALPPCPLPQLHGLRAPPIA